MSAHETAAGAAALSICESILLSLTDNGVIDQPELLAILGDAARSHHEAAALDGAPAVHASAAALIDALIAGGNSVRRLRPTEPEPEPPPDAC